MDFELTDDQVAIRDAVADLCSRFPQEYWSTRSARRAGSPC
jgi:acyl-CoA dehydrogenase